MKYLVVVDMQNDFITGSLGTKEAEAIVPKVVEEIKTFDGAVFLTQDTHYNNYLDTQEGKMLPVPHCIYPTDGWGIHKDITHAIACGNCSYAELVAKRTFGASTLPDTIRTYASVSKDQNIDEIVLVGLCTDICVISNALLLKAYFPEVKITVDAACCAGVTPESHENALKAMKICQVNIENWEG